jgi:hypothetical protein
LNGWVNQMALSEKTVLFSGSISGNGQTPAIAIPSSGAAQNYFLSAIASAVGAGTSLVLKLQHSPDGGTTWFDVDSLTAVTPSALAQGKAINTGLLPKVRVDYAFTGGTTTSTLVIALNSGVAK